MNKGLYFLIGLALCSCSTSWQQFPSNAIAGVDKHYLYRSQVEDYVPVFFSAEDSLRFVEDYVERWTVDELMYRSSHVDDEIERRVEQYRKELYIYAYEQQLVEQRMSKQVDEISIEQFYEKNIDQFVLHEPIMKGLVVIVSQSAPGVNQLKSDIRLFTENSIEPIEKYAYQYAKGYALFLEEWRTASQLHEQVPLSGNSWARQLAQYKYYEQSDSLYTYIIKATEFINQGENMPIDYAKEMIKKDIIDRRKLNFLETERHKLYENAVKKGKIKIYEQN